MIPWQHLDRTLAPDGTTLALARRGDDYAIFADGRILMLSEAHGSEDALGTLGCARAVSAGGADIQLLIGGLGMGFTLRAALDALPASASVTIAELLPIVIEWNRGALGALAGHPLQDARVRLVSGDVSTCISGGPGRFDAVLLDVDNGPAAFTTLGNDSLYERAGLARVRAALRPGGVLAVWSARDDKPFTKRLRNAGFGVTVHRVSTHRNGGQRRVVFVATT